MKDHFSFIVYSSALLCFESAFKSGREREYLQGHCSYCLCGCVCLRVSVCAHVHELASCPSLKLVLMMHQSELLHNLAASWIVNKCIPLLLYINVNTNGRVAHPIGRMRGRISSELSACTNLKAAGGLFPIFHERHNEVWRTNDSNLRKQISSKMLNNFQGFHRVARRIGEQHRYWPEYWCFSI